MKLGLEISAVHFQIRLRLENETKMPTKTRLMVFIEQKHLLSFSNFISVDFNL
jgi:hypothetical protein